MDKKIELQISRRIFNEPKFATADGKAVFTTISMAKIPKGKFTMASIWSEGQFNTIVYEETDTFRMFSIRWVVMMNCLDMAELNITDGDRVNLENKTGKMENVLVKTYSLPRAMRQPSSRKAINYAQHNPYGSELISNALYYYKKSFRNILKKTCRK